MKRNVTGPKFFNLIYHLSHILVVVLVVVVVVVSIKNGFTPQG